LSSDIDNKKSLSTEDHGNTTVTTTPLILSTLSLLFGILMSSSPQNKSVLLSLIEGDGERSKLERLVRQAKEFVVLYADDEEEGEEQEEKGKEKEKDVSSSSSSRMTTRSGKKGMREVVSVLERLCDECRKG